MTQENTQMLNTENAFTALQRHSIKGKYMKGEWEVGAQKKEKENWIDVWRARRARLKVKGQLFYCDKSSITE